MKLFLVGLAFVASVTAGSQYLPPVQDSLSVLEEIEKIEPSGALANDGYRYRTVKRYRRRRDVGELSPEYLPPAQELAIPVPEQQYLGPIEAVESIADDGYRYKTVKRLRHRNRRDVSELSSAQYLPPVQQESGYSYPAPIPAVAPAPVLPHLPVEAPAPVEIAAPVEVEAPVQETAELANDGYRYKTVRRIRYRHRRDVNELSPEYLPPVQQELFTAEPNSQYLSPVEGVEPIEQIADDGYRYKTVKRLRHRNRRDVSELSSAQYLPPVQQESGYSYPAPIPAVAPAPALPHLPIEAPAPVEIAAPVEVEAPVQETAELANDGYRYKTVRRIRYRHRRDVNELPNEYLPPVVSAPAAAGPGYSYPAPAPVEVSAPAPAPVEIAAPVEIPAPVEVSAPIEAHVEPTAELASDGYRYKTVRRIRYRHRRDVNELLSGEYLPPGHEAALPELNDQYLSPELQSVQAVEEPIEHIADDGYRYKTVKKYKIKRH